MVVENAPAVTEEEVLVLTICAVNAMVSVGLAPGEEVEPESNVP